jgi:hypothetical protein
MFPDPAAIAESLILRSAEGASRRMIERATPANALRGQFAAPQGEGLSRAPGAGLFHVKQASA